MRDDVIGLFGKIFPHLGLICACAGVQQRIGLLGVCRDLDRSHYIVRTGLVVDSRTANDTVVPADGFTQSQFLKRQGGDMFFRHNTRLLMLTFNIIM